MDIDGILSKKGSQTDALTGQGQQQITQSQDIQLSSNNYRKKYLFWTIKQFHYLQKISKIYFIGVFYDFDEFINQHNVNNLELISINLINNVSHAYHAYKRFIMPFIWSGWIKNVLITHKIYTRTILTLYVNQYRFSIS